jgi:hypothetical protein
MLVETGHWIAESFFLRRVRPGCADETSLQVKRSMDDRRWSKTMHLSESDLRFLVETVATNRRDYDHIVNLVRDKEDLLETMLEDPKLTERLFRDEKALVRITPHMLFSVLLRQLRRELENEAYVLDVDTNERAGKRFYHVAAQETDQTQWKPVLGMLAEKFTLARLALNSLSDRYVKTLRSRYFQSPAE